MTHEPEDKIPTSELRIEFNHDGQKYGSRVVVLGDSVPGGEWPDWIMFAATQLGHQLANHVRNELEDPES